MFKAIVVIILAVSAFAANANQVMQIDGKDFIQGNYVCENGEQVTVMNNAAIVNNKFAVIDGKNGIVTNYLDRLSFTPDNGATRFCHLVK